MISRGKMLTEVSIYPVIIFFYKSIYLERYLESKLYNLSKLIKDFKMCNLNYSQNTQNTVSTNKTNWIKKSS